MRFGIDTIQIRDELLVDVFIALHYQGVLSVLRSIPEMFSAKEHSQFEGHIESGQICRIQFDARKVVNAVTAALHFANDLEEPDLGAVILIQRGLREKPTAVNCIDDSPQDWLIIVIEGTIDKDGIVITWSGHNGEEPVTSQWDAETVALAFLAFPTARGLTLLRVGRAEVYLAYTLSTACRTLVRETVPRRRAAFLIMVFGDDME